MPVPVPSVRIDHKTTGKGRMMRNDVTTLVLSGMLVWAFIGFVTATVPGLWDRCVMRYPVGTARIRYTVRTGRLYARRAGRTAVRVIRYRVRVARIRTGRRWGFLRAAGVLTRHCVPVWLTRYGITGRFVYCTGSFVNWIRYAVAVNVARLEL